MHKTRSFIYYCIQEKALYTVYYQKLYILHTIRSQTYFKHLETSHTSYNMKLYILPVYSKKLYILHKKKNLAILHITRGFMYFIHQKALHTAYNKNLDILHKTKKLYIYTAYNKKLDVLHASRSQQHNKNLAIFIQQESRHTSYTKKLDILHTTSIGITKLDISQIHFIQQETL